MTPVELRKWMNDHSGPGVHWCLKRLAGNDTRATGAHQAGPYFRKQILFDLFPDLYDPGTRNPDVRFPFHIDSHDDYRQVRAVWYNNKYHPGPGKRDETRLTGFGGASSALLDPNNTGALVLFAFSNTAPKGELECHAWVCEEQWEEDLIEDRTGLVEPGTGTVLTPHLETVSVFTARKPRKDCWLEPSEIPSQWLDRYPSGQEFARKSLELLRCGSLPPDKRIMQRRDCEYELFRSVEEAVELPKIRLGFDNMETFLSLAQSILQRRKARSGNSLEIHIREIFKEEGLLENQQFAYQIETSRGRRPDFVFPSKHAYLDPTFPTSQLRMLAVKTTCKDRWRQVLNEADRKLPWTHLLTVQEGVSELQYKEMVESRVTLVVPEPLRSKFPSAIRAEIQTLEAFIDEVRRLDRRLN